jgi:hypothetical protein
LDSVAPKLTELKQRVAEPTGHGVTLRSILIGLVLMLVNLYWVTLIEVRWYSLDGSCLPMFITPVFMLFCLAVCNLALLKIAPRFAFTRAELLVIYIMVVISETLGGHDFIQNLFGVLGHPFHFASPENKWEDIFQQYVPRWLTVSDPYALRAFYEGGEQFWKKEVLTPFIVPLLAWGGFLLVSIFVMLCLNVLVRKAWTEDERLAFPLIVLPLELTKGQESARFFRNKLMWGGFATALVIDLVNGLHALIPTIPEIQYIKLFELAQYFPGRPWNAMGSTRTSLYPFAIGLAFFLPSDLSFSCWFFYVLSKLELIVSSKIGWETTTGLPYLNQQASGAWLALGLTAIYATRNHLSQVWRHIRGEATALSDADEPLPYKTALLGVVAGLIALVVFCSYAGMSVGTILGFFAIFYTLSIAITRVRAELGTPHEIYFVNPHRIMVEVAGVRTFGTRNLTALSTTYWFNRCYRCHPMPFQLEALKMTEFAAINRRWLAGAMMLATFAAIIMSYWANMYITVREGASAHCQGYKGWVGFETYSRLASWIQTPEKTNLSAIAAMIFGGALVVGLRALRFRYTSLPFHPAGYALAISFAMDYFWFAFFVSWLIKTVIMRYWGQKAHRQGIWYFSGLILGDYVCGSIWAIIGPIMGKPNYKIFI